MTRLSSRINRVPLVMLGVCLLLLLAFCTATVFVQAAWALQSFQIGIFALLVVYFVAGVRSGREPLRRRAGAMVRVRNTHLGFGADCGAYHRLHLRDARKCREMGRSCRGVLSDVKLSAGPVSPARLPQRISLVRYGDVFALPVAALDFRGARPLDIPHGIS